MVALRMGWTLPLAKAQTLSVAPEKLKRAGGPGFHRHLAGDAENLLDRGAGGEQFRFAAMASDELHADRDSIGGETGRDRQRRARRQSDDPVDGQPADIVGEFVAI